MNIIKVLKELSMKKQALVNDFLVSERDLAE